MKLHWQVLIALCLGLACGQFTRIGVGWESFGFVTIAGVSVEGVYDFIGQLFLRSLQMLIVPLIAAAIVTAIMDLGGSHAFGRLGIKTVGYYLTTSTLAIFAGLLMVNLIRPGEINGAPASDLLGLAASAEEVRAAVGDKGAGDIVDVLKRMIPTNIVEAAGDNREMLAVIFFSLLFGYFAAKVQGDAQGTIQRFWQAVYDVMLQITGFVMRFAPIGVFGLVAKVSAGTAPADLASLLKFFITVILALAIHFLIVLPLLLRFLGGVSPWKHARAMLPALTTAFSTSSSSATLPVTIECLRENAGVSARTTNFVTPLGATVNMDGTALYECVAVIFLAQVYGAGLSLGAQLTVVFLALVTSIGVAGVPSASLVAIVVILSALNLPIEGIGLLMVFDRILDMCRTSVNVYSDSCGAVIIARSEGEATAVAVDGAGPVERETP
ncbi:MAG TPA: dicarboxylate/amino acid:cation symporter [Opitutaceae bacterium]